MSCTVYERWHAHTALELSNLNWSLSWCSSHVCTFHDITRWRRSVMPTWWPQGFLIEMETDTPETSVAWRWTSWPSWARSNYATCLAFLFGSELGCTQVPQHWCAHLTRTHIWFDLISFIENPFKVVLWGLWVSLSPWEEWSCMCWRIILIMCIPMSCLMTT